MVDLVTFLLVWSWLRSEIWENIQAQYFSQRLYNRNIFH